MLTQLLSLRADDSDPGKNGPYNYTPTTYVCVIFLVLFSISTLAHTAQAIYYRMWWFMPTIVVGGLLEVLGWSGRLWSSFNPVLLSPFLLQITTTILAPTHILAADFIIFGRIIHRLGAHYSRLSPMWYSIIFCGCDLVSLTVQGIGGGIASSAAGNGRDPTNGGHIMLGGIILQMVTMSLYVLLAAEFFVRFFTDTPVRSTGSSSSKKATLDTRMKIMIVALTFNTICLFIRAVYRTIELLDGWSGAIISNQLYFNVLDGAMIVLALYAINFAHPGFMLADDGKGSYEEVYPLSRNKFEGSF